MFIGIIVVQVMGYPPEDIQNIPVIYMLGVLVSKLSALFFVYIFRLFLKIKKHETGKHFYLLMAAMPMQSIILCFIVYGYSADIAELRTPTLGTIAITISLLLLFILMVILSNQSKAFEYKKEYELAQTRLKMQVEHYQNLNQAQHEVRGIRHRMSNDLIAISGALKNGLVDEATARVNEILADIAKTADIVDTGIPPVDAVLNAKIAKAQESGIIILHKVLVDDELNADLIDLAVIVASALDNAIEGVLRSKNAPKTITVKISSGIESGYISILVENYTSGSLDENFETSKTDKKNHGFGLKQMRDIAIKNDGDIEPCFDPNTGKFSLYVLLRNRQM